MCTVCQIVFRNDLNAFPFYNRRSGGGRSGWPDHAKVLSVWGYSKYCITNGVQWIATQDTHQSSVSTGVVEDRRVRDGGTRTRQPEGQGGGAHLLAHRCYRQGHTTARGNQARLFLNIFIF